MISNNQTSKTLVYFRLLDFSVDKLELFSSTGLTTCGKMTPTIVSVTHKPSLEENLPDFRPLRHN